MQMLIDTDKRLEVHLKLFKSRMLREGCGKFQLYPAFCTYYAKNKEKYTMSKMQVLDKACEILVEED